MNIALKTTILLVHACLQDVTLMRNRMKQGIYAFILWPEPCGHYEQG